MSGDGEGRLDPGQTVVMCAKSSKVQQLLRDLDGASVVSIDGQILRLRVSSPEGDWEVEVARRYFCRGLIGYVGAPCISYGLENPPTDD